jgi:hypothetical protein
MRKKNSKPFKAKTGNASPASHALIQNQHGNILMSNYKFDKFYKALKSYLKSHNLPVCLHKVHYTNGNFNRCYGNTRIVYDAIKLTNNELCDITFIPHEKGIELSKIEIFNRCNGLGTDFMNAFVEISANTRVAIYLIPGVLNNNEYTSIERLCGFYPRFGFKKLSLSKFWSNSYVNGNIRPNPYKIKTIETQKLAS